MGGDGWFDMGLHIIKPAPIFMVESHPPYLVCTHSSFLRLSLVSLSPSLPPLSLYARHRAIKFGNSIPPAAFTYTRTCHSRPLSLALRFRPVARRLKPTAFYKRIKVNDGGAPSAIPRETHPSGWLARRGEIRACAPVTVGPPRATGVARVAGAKIVFLFTIPGEPVCFVRTWSTLAISTRVTRYRGNDATAARTSHRRTNATHKGSL